MRAVPLFAFCLLRKGLSGHSRNAPLSAVCFIHFFGFDAFIDFCKDGVPAAFLPPLRGKLCFHRSCVRKELTAALCVRAWSWYNIATELQFVIFLHSAVECTSLSMGLVLLRSKFRKVQRVGDDRECFAPHPLTKRGCCKYYWCESLFSVCRGHGGPPSMHLRFGDHMILTTFCQIKLKFNCMLKQFDIIAFYYAS